MKKIYHEADEYIIAYEVGYERLIIARFDGLVVKESVIEDCFEKICNCFKDVKVTFVIAVELYRPWDEEPYKRYEV